MQSVICMTIFEIVFLLTETTESFKYMRWMLNKGKSCEMVEDNIEVSPKKAEKIAELLKAEKLID